MQIVINISEESYKNIKEQVDKRDYPDMQIGRAIVDGKPLTQGHCKDCKWWKDSDGEYRRGCGAESKCPINRREVFEGNGYCYLFEPQESERRND